MDKGSMVIYNGVDLNQWPLVRDSREYLFWFGRMVHAKGLDIVIDAAHELNMPLMFAGPLDDQKYFDEQIRPRLKENDIYLGHLKQSDLGMYMKGAAAVVNAVRWEEPFGLSNIEAMASGVPLAGFDRGAFAELVNFKSGVVAEQRNVKSLAEAITAAMLLESNEVRRHAETFSLRTMAQRYITYFNEVL